MSWSGSSMAAAELMGFDAVGQADLVRQGDVSPLELVDAAIAQSERLNPQINALIHERFDEARAEAQGNVSDGPFRGVPITLKDLWPASAGDPFCQGVVALKNAGFTQSADSNLVTRYRQAGFIIIGRTNTAELGLSATTEPVAFGPTRNPWDLNHAAGGSSGGAAASVAAGITAIANASDGGGSIRIPAAHNGLVGLKPSRGRLSMGPLQEEWNNSVQHVVCHTMRDAAASLDATCAPFPGDGMVAPSVGAPFASFLDGPTRPLRIGFTTVGRPGIATDPWCADATERVATMLESLGHRVERDESPAALHAESTRGTQTVLSSVATATALSGIAAMLGRPVTENDVEPGTWMLAQMASNFSGEQVVAAQADQMRFRHDMLGWWGDGWDLLLTPTCAAPPPTIGELVATDDDPFRAQVASIPFAVFTSAFNVTGQPALAIPAGLTPSGLPLSVQLVAGYGREDQLVAIGSQLEAEIDWAAKRSPLARAC